MAYTLGACATSGGAPETREVTEGAGGSPVHPCEMTPVYLDADGDGHPAARESTRSVCAGQSTPGFTTLSTFDLDCDDLDPGLWKTRCLDLDGDGAVSRHCVGDDAGPEFRGCPWVLEWTPEPGPYDCDDEDASHIDFFYRDQDADGFGAGDPLCSSPAPGLSAWSGDCADGDATRYPFSVELPGDGIDSDCDGSDGARCAPDPSFSDFDWPSVAASPQTPCEGPNLALGVLSCSSCLLASATFAVENRGTLRFEGDVTVSNVDMPLHVQLDPGQRAVLVSGPFVGDYLLSLAARQGLDCDPSDNRATASAGHCL